MRSTKNYSGTQYNEVPRDWQNEFVVWGSSPYIYWTFTGLKNIVRFSGAGSSSKMLPSSRLVQSYGEKIVHLGVKASNSAQ